MNEAAYKLSNSSNPNIPTLEIFKGHKNFTDYV